MDAIPETLDGRYERATEIRLETPLHVSVVTAGLIRAGVSKNTLKAYRRCQIDGWSGMTLRESVRTRIHL